MLNSSEYIKCSACGRTQTAITDPESGEVICSNCGMVITYEQTQDFANPERHTFTTQQSNQRARIGVPNFLSRHDKGLATIIGEPTKDAAGRKLDTDMRYRFKRLRIWDARMQLHSSTDKNLLKAFSELYTLKDKLGLSDSLVEKTAYLYRKVEDRGLVRGRTIVGMLAACVYVACREVGAPRTIKDIAVKTNVSRKELARNCRLVMEGLDITTPVFDPIKCIVKVASAAQVSERTKRHAFKMMNELLRKKILTAGKNPMSLAASILYIACKEIGENKTQMYMARAAGVTEVTIRNRIRDLGKSLNLSTV